MADKDITVPSLLSVNIIFIAITSVYLCVKLLMGDNLMLGGFYLVLILFTQYLYNMWIILGTHKTSDTAMALTSLVFWVIFVLIYFIINMGFPSWKVPFSNTIGYAVADIINPISTAFKGILKDGSSTPFIASDPIDVHTPAHKDDSALLLALRNMKSDPHFVLTKANYANHPQFLKDLKENKVFIDDDEERVNAVFSSIGQWYLYKDIISEGVWLMLAGSLTIAVTYYYIVSAPISSSPEAIAKSDANQKLLQEKDNAAPAKPKFFTQPLGSLGSFKK